MDVRGVMLQPLLRKQHQVIDTEDWDAHLLYCERYPKQNISDRTFDRFPGNCPTHSTIFRKTL